MLDFWITMFLLCAKFEIFPSSTFFVQVLKFPPVFCCVQNFWDFSQFHFFVQVLKFPPIFCCVQNFWDFLSSTFVCRWQSSGEWKVIYCRNSNDLFRVSSEILFQIEIGRGQQWAWNEQSLHFTPTHPTTKGAKLLKRFGKIWLNGNNLHFLSQ